MRRSGPERAETLWGGGPRSRLLALAPPSQVQPPPRREQCPLGPGKPVKDHSLLPGWEAALPPSVLSCSYAYTPFRGSPQAVPGGVSSPGLREPIVRISSHRAFNDIRAGVCNQPPGVFAPGKVANARRQTLPQPGRNYSPAPLPAETSARGCRRS